VRNMVSKFAFYMGQLVSLRRGKVEPVCGALEAGLLLPLPGGCRISYMDNTGCHQLDVLTIRPTRLAPTPGGCRIGYMDHTGCHQLLFWAAELALPGVTRFVTWAIPDVINWRFDREITRVKSAANPSRRYPSFQDHILVREAGLYKLNAVDP
jgi:hypothetical protein